MSQQSLNIISFIIYMITMQYPLKFFKFVFSKQSSINTLKIVYEVLVVVCGMILFLW